MDYKKMVKSLKPGQYIRFSKSKEDAPRIVLARPTIESMCVHVNKESYDKATPGEYHLCDEWVKKYGERTTLVYHFEKRVHVGSVYAICMSDGNIWWMYPHNGFDVWPRLCTLTTEPTAEDYWVRLE